MRIALEHVSMLFGGVQALDDVSFGAASGEVTCLLGDNGAGKSTLIRVLSGVYRPTAGTYRIDDEAVEFTSPRAALERGIGTVHQDLALIPLMSVWRNFYLGAEPTRGRGLTRRIDVRHARESVTAIMAEFGIALRDPDQPIGRMSGGERQTVAIARALQRGARMLILDEPTAALGVKQAAKVLASMVTAKQRGVGIVLVTHNPQHAFSVGDRFVILQQGRVREITTRGQVTVEQLAGAMSGAD
jgi:simple sugar transport system ATP-binding protein